MFQALNLEEKMNGEDFLKMDRCGYIVPGNDDPPDEIIDEMELPLTLVKKDFLNDAEKVALEDVVNFSVYKTIAKLNPKRLTALSIEEYRLKRIAKDQFSLTFPVRTHHDWATFSSYGQLLCELFQLENAAETLQTLFSNIAQPEGLTETGFVQILKQLIGYQMKSAQSRALREEEAMEGVRQLLANESALQEHIHQQFSAIDLDHDGLISLQEAKLLVKEMGMGDKEEDNAEYLMVVLDRDKDGKVGFEDYCWFIKAYLRHSANS
jgi:Ca2+-binding EF-hand superfamily protein